MTGAIMPVTATQTMMQVSQQSVFGFRPEAKGAPGHDSGSAGCAAPRSGKGGYILFQQAVADGKTCQFGVI